MAVWESPSSDWRQVTEGIATIIRGVDSNHPPIGLDHIIMRPVTVQGSEPPGL